MNYFLEIDLDQVWRTAYLEAKKRYGKKHTLNAQNLLDEAQDIYWSLRDNVIFYRLEQIHQRWGQKLLPLADLIAEKLYDTDRDAYRMLMTICHYEGEDDEYAYNLANAIAIIEWWRAVWLGQINEHVGTVDDARVWLDRQAYMVPPPPPTDEQLSLF